MLLASKKIATVIGQSMLLNMINIVLVRMQNIDYKNNRNVFKAVLDLYKIDGYRAFYIGLVPISIGYAKLHIVKGLIPSIGKDDNLLSHAVWPFFYSFGLLTVHPWFVLGMRAQCSPMSMNPRQS
jgi:hypothetical protein